MKTILVLGAGTGGIVTARELSKHSGNEDDINLVNILVFEKEERSVFAPSLPWIMVGQRKPEEVYESYKKLDASGLEIIKGEIENVDPENITVTVNGKLYKGDYMVVSLGVEQKSDMDLDIYGYNFFTLDGATQFNTDLGKLVTGKIAILVSSLPFKSPAAPYEAAMLIEDYVRKAGISHRVEVSLYSPESGPMEFAGEQASLELKRLIEHKGIKYYPNHQVTAVTKNRLEFSNGSSYGYDLLAFTPRHQSPAVIRSSSLAAESGWIEADPKSLETRFPNVYAIGDITNIKLANGVILPKIGIFARQQAEIVAHNIGRKIGNSVPDQAFKGEGQYYIEYGDGLASTTDVNFYDDPKETHVKMKTPEVLGHWHKWWAEKYWFFKNF
ncbi:MAG TPA: FAD-dependent oxidoreductase [Gillisia sp.]|nr:FAD-dependent oxidoreductase [Gillisia sp.]